MKENCQHITPLLAAYALEALDPDERRLVETHLSECDSCQAELADYQAISNGLLEAAPPLQPPARLRSRLLTAVAAPRQERNWRSRIARPAMWIGAAAVVVLAALNIVMLGKTNRMLQSVELLSNQYQASQTALALMTYPDSQVAVIDDGQVYGTLVYDLDGQVAVLNMWGLATLPAGQAYQVWLIAPDQSRTSGGVFLPSRSQAYTSMVIDSPEPFRLFSGIGITIEPEGGSPGPTGPKVFGVDL